jgi:ribosome-binding protein aMBF1 (putative translation factor)
MRRKKSDFMRWVDHKLASDDGLAQRVEAALAEMRVEQDLAARRAALGMTQTELARRMRVSQPFVATLESGRVKNLELRTLHRWAAALGTRLTVEVSAESSRPPRSKLAAAKR